LGLTRIVAIEASRRGIGYREFYESIIDWGRATRSSIIGDMIRWVDGLLDRVLSGEPWDTVIDGCGNITWPPEEAAFLMFMVSRSRFYFSLGRFLDHMGLGMASLMENDRLMVTPDRYPTIEDYAREVVWYGRKGGAFMDPSWAETLKAEGGENESVSNIAMPVH